MKTHKTAIHILCTILPLAATTVCGGELEEKFAWQQPIEGAKEIDITYRVRLPGKVFAECHDFPDDMRVLDAASDQLPFFVWMPARREKIDPVKAKRLNLAHFEGPPAYWRQDLSVPEKTSGGRRKHNRVTIRTGGSDFIRRVEILASSDKKNWSLLGSGFLISMYRPSWTRNETIDYPDSDFPHLQIRVYPNAREGLEKYKIHDVDIFYRHLTPGRLETVALENKPLAAEDEREDAQVRVYDTGFKQRPVERLVFETDTPEYARPVRVYRRNRKDRDWISCGNGEIHSLDGSAKNEIELGNCTARFLKIEIYHYDDKPLSIRRIVAKAVPREIVFQATSTNRPSLYYGALFVDRPHYDLRRRTDLDEIAELAVARLGDPVENASFNPPGYGRIGPWLAVLAIALVSILVIKVIIDMMKQQNLPANK